MKFGSTCCQDPPSFVETKIPLYVPAITFVPPEPFGTTPTELTSVSSMSIPAHVTPSSIDLKMPNVAPHREQADAVGAVGIDGEVEGRGA